jgi:ABC-2 type transport system permease protein
VVLLASGHGVALLWNNVPLSQMSITLSYHLIAIHALYYSPIYCWMLLVSGWARRATFLWATLPVFAVAVLEKIAFNGSHFSTLIVNRFKGGESAGIGVKTGVMMHPLTFEVVGRFLSSPGLWIGLAVAAAFLAAAVRVRRYQGPI